MMTEGFELADYACKSSDSRGRALPERPSTARTEFQRDRDRVIHSSAFRRLEYKTQVFVNHEGDLFRTRLTHTLEVGQIARVAASRLSINPDLAESIALAHDLGHTPFGHAGQEALNKCMEGHGGFEHNLQSLRIVDRLEEQYPLFNGLNLTWETREGILKHCDPAKAAELGDLGARFRAGTQPGLEAQLVNIADEIAYSTHDIDDGLRAGYITSESLAASVPLYDRYWSEVRAEYPNIPRRRQEKEVVRRIIGYMVDDLVATSRECIAQAAPRSVEDVRALTAPLVRFSDEGWLEVRRLKDCLMQDLYRHYMVLRVVTKYSRLVKTLFDAFVESPRLMPPSFSARASGPSGPWRAVSDYVAGMTDRYAVVEFKRVLDPASHA